MAVLVETRDNVVSIPAVESLKMLTFSVIWGTWIVLRNAVVRIVGPLLLKGRGRRRRDRADGSPVPDAQADERLAGLELTDRPPKCLFTTVYGIHSYVKIKVRQCSRTEKKKPITC